MAASTYLIDLAPERAAESATLLATVRFPFGAAVCALSEKIVPLIGRTTTKEVFATVALLTLPAVFILYKYGERIRANHVSKFSV